MGDLPYAPIVPNGVGRNYGTKAVPTYVMAEAETAPLPKITVEEPPPPPPPARRSLPARLGDLPMRVIYRSVVGVVAALAVATAAVVFFVTGWGKGTPTAAGPGGVEPLATVAPAGAVTPVPSDSPAPSVLSGPSSPPVPASSPAAEPAPTQGRSALVAAQADSRVPKLPSDRELARFRGHAAATKGRVKDKRSGVTFVRFVKGWKLARSSPFATRRTLPGAKGADHRGMLASCPVPIAVQEKLKDTAFLAARWTLNYHPEGSKITWTASQPIKAGKREGWLLGYRVNYEVGGKKHLSNAAVALVDVPSAKPALVFITIPDAQKKRWTDINTVMSSLRAL
ncbi:MAG: hypothetical protein JWQ95_2535 [Sphaerisporangium sp.]|jgi:hypothetical protein|nr:hypothetical protein [Sphaerisporangium sp.]